MTDTVVRARVSPALKAAAMVNAKALGLDLSIVMNLENGVDIFKEDL